MDDDIKAVLIETQQENPLLPILTSYFGQFKWNEVEKEWTKKTKIS